MSDDLYIYDKAKWHYEGEDYPRDLAEFHAYTHGGFLLAWLLSKDLLSESFLSDHAEVIQQFQAGKLSAGKFNQKVDGVLDSSMLTEQGNEFANDYIEEFFLDDYEMMFGDDYTSAYETLDNKANLKSIMNMLDVAYQEWLEATETPD